jgi:hypothetical protein
VADAVSVRAHFERFPATVKGAFVVRGEDPDPHQIAIHAAHTVAAGGARVRQVPLAPVTLDVAPHVDLFVPFELPLSDFEPGWYGFECEADVDGVSFEFRVTRRFLVPWPRATVRRGSLAIGEKLRGGAGTVAVERLDCLLDQIKVHVTADPPDEPSLRLSADGSPLPVLDVEMDPETGRGVVAAYPILRSHGRLTVELTGRGSSGAGVVEVPLE